MPTTIKTPIKKVFVAGTATPSAVNVNAASRLPSAPAHPQECCCPACVGLACLDRTRYFSGQLLSEADLNNEQSYWLAKSRLHNRFLHGWGIVCGMQVVCSECDGWVTVKPGYAIDPCGNDIIVCSDYAFNVIKAIQACCTPSKSTANCAPLRSSPPANCQDTTQTWCISIEYLEQPSRLVTPLKQPTAKSANCSCGESKGGCGCGCGGHGNGNGSSHGCSCKSTAQQSPSVPAGACEPTRINEGFRLCVTPAPSASETPGDSLPGTAAYRMEQCIAQIRQLIQQAPQVGSNNSNGITDPQLAYSAVCNYLAMVKNYFASASVERCLLLDELTQILVPAPPFAKHVLATVTPANYLDQLGGVVNELTRLVTNTALDCLCIALIPPCPPDPCDDRVCLACVTVRDGKILNICHFGCRQQVVTFDTLYYWLSLVGFDRTLLLLKRFFEALCCGERNIRGLFGASAYQRESLTSAGFTNPGMVNQMLSAMVTQKLGSTFVNAINPSSQAVDLRPLVGLNPELAIRSLQSYKISPQNITTTAVDSDPAWSDEAIAAGAHFTPSAFSPSENLTMYTKGKAVVGFDVTDPVSALKSQVQRLQEQVDRFTNARGTDSANAASRATKTRPQKGPNR